METEQMKTITISFDVLLENVESVEMERELLHSYVQELIDNEELEYKISTKGNAI